MEEQKSGREERMMGLDPALSGIMGSIYRLGLVHWNLPLKQLTRNEFLILEFIYWKPRHCRGSDAKEKRYGELVSSGEIARGLKLSTQSVSRSLKVLEQKGYLQRRADEEDRRQILVQLTREGTGLRLAEEAEINQFYQAAIGRVGKEKLEQMLGLMKEITEAFETEAKERKQQNRKSGKRKER